MAKGSSKNQPKKPQGSTQKLQELSQSHVIFRRNFFTTRMNNIPRAVVESPLLKMFQNHEDTEPGDVGQGWPSQCWVGLDLRGLFPPQQLHGSLIPCPWRRYPDTPGALTFPGELGQIPTCSGRTPQASGMEIWVQNQRILS